MNEDIQKTSPQPPSQEGGLPAQPKYVIAEPHTYVLIKEERARLKKNVTKAEKVLWEQLNHKRLGYRFRRQYVIHTFIVDFVCLPKNLIIEVDGEIHNSQKESDAERTTHLNSLGYTVIRFSNEEVLTNPISVAEKIKNYLDRNTDILNNNQT